MRGPWGRASVLVASWHAGLLLVAGLAAKEGAHAGGSHAAAPSDPELQCEVDASGPICLGSQSQVLLPPAQPSGLAGFWSFDSSLPLDASGNGNHGKGSVIAGPSLAGQGSSAFFHRSLLTISGAAALELHDFSYTFWLYFIEERLARAPSKTPLVCPIVRKGLETPDFQKAAAPAILFDRASRALRVELLTSPDGDATSAAEAFESQARLSPGRWFHVAVVRVDSQRMTHLYVNGILDSSRASDGFVVANREPLYVGGDPRSRMDCDLPMYIDELRVYSRPLEVDEIQAEASPSLGGIEPALVRLACTQCPLEAAVQNCPGGYHICSSRELHMGGYQVARALGWLQPNTHVWSHAPAGKDGGQGVPRLSLAGERKTSAAAPAGAPAPAPAVAPAAFSRAPPPSPPALGLGICCSDDS